MYSLNSKDQIIYSNRLISNVLMHKKCKYSYDSINKGYFIILTMI